MCNQETLVDYLYGELAAAERASFEAHLAVCADCRQEAAGLSETRQHLTSWSPPEPTMKFRIVPSSRPVARPAGRRVLGAVPAWALTAAAMLFLLAGASALANLQVDYGSGTLTVRTGWAGTAGAPAMAVADPEPEPAALPAAAPVQSSEDLRAALVTLTRRLEALETTQADQAVQLAASRPWITAPELRRILTESESRQRTEMALRIEGLWKDLQAARASDFMRVQQTLAPELQRQQRSIENLYRVSLQR
jgi:anti-sigma factor RsiW